MAAAIGWDRRNPQLQLGVQLQTMSTPWRGQDCGPAHELLLHRAQDGFSFAKFGTGKLGTGAFDGVAQHEQVGGRNQGPAVEGMDNPARGRTAGRTEPGMRFLSSNFLSCELLSYEFHQGGLS